MKFSILALGAAVAGITGQCFAQIQIESSFPARNTQTRLVSQNQDFFGAPQPSADQPSSSDHSDYYSAEAPQAEIDEQSDTAIGPRSVLETPVADEATTPSKTKPVNTKAPLEVLAMTPEVGMVPVCWQNTSGCVTPNPVANYMVRSWCTNGLWDTYPCQRAQQCANIQKHIHGYNRYTGCVSCGTGGCGAGGCGTGACAPIGVPGSCATGNCGPASSACALNITDKQAIQLSGLAATTPAPSSPFVGELQAGLPVIDVPQLSPSQVQMTAYGSQPQLPTMPVLPSGQPVLQLPADVPTVPANAVPSRMPSFQPGMLPSLPVPGATPAVASRPSASLR